MNDLKDFKQEMISQNLADNTINSYISVLRKIPADNGEQKIYLGENRENRMLICAYRKYLKFQRKWGLISA